MRASLCLIVTALTVTLTTGISAASPPAGGLDAVPWARSLEEAQQIAAQRHQLILLHFYGDNCPPCKALEANVFPRQDFARGLTADYVPVKINASQNRQLAAKYGIQNWPTDVIVTADGTPIMKPVNCPADPVKYLAMLDQVAAAHRVRMNPEAQVAQNVAYNQPASTQQTPTAGGPMNGAARDPRVAAAGQNQVQPQQNMYDPNGYKPMATADARDPRSSFQPANAGQAYVQGTPYQDPRSNLPTDRGAGISVAENPRGIQSQASDSVYGQAAEGQSNANVRLNQAPPMQQQQIVTQPPMQPRPQMQANPTIAAQPDPRVQVNNAPPANPPIALEGYCPVTLTEVTKWTKGDVRFGAIHRGRTYLFVTAAEQQKFLANPDKYSPMLSGYDPVKYIESGVLVDGNRKHGCVHEGHMYLFADEAALTKFWESPNAFTNPVRQAMQQSITPTNYR